MIEERWLKLVPASPPLPLADSLLLQLASLDLKKLTFSLPRQGQSVSYSRLSVWLEFLKCERKDECKNCLIDFSFQNGPKGGNASAKYINVVFSCLIHR